MSTLKQLVFDNTDIIVKPKNDTINPKSDDEYEAVRVPAPSFRRPKRVVDSDSDAESEGSDWEDK